MIRRPPRSTLDRSSAASDVYKRQLLNMGIMDCVKQGLEELGLDLDEVARAEVDPALGLSLIHISEPTRPY